MAESPQLRECKAALGNNEGADNFEGKKDGFISSDASKECHTKALRTAQNALGEEGGFRVADLIKKAPELKNSGDSQVAKLGDYLIKYGMK